MESKQIDEIEGNIPSSLLKETIIRTLVNYQNAYLDRPKDNWPTYEFVYRWVLRMQIDDLIHRFRKEDKRITDVVKEMEDWCNKAIDELGHPFFNLYMSALNELYDIAASI